MAQYLNLSCTGFYPFVYIFGKQMKADVQMANPTLMHGRITKNDETSIKRPRRQPTKRPKFTKANNLETKCSQISLQANKNPMINNKALPKAKFRTTPNIKIIISYCNK